MSELLKFLTSHEDQFRRNRLAALYSDFRHLRITNPDGYAANIEAWRKGLADAARQGFIPSRGISIDHLLLTLNDELLRALETKEWGRPLALGTVVREAIARKEMMPLSDFLAAEESIYHKSWTTKALGVLSWGLSQLGLAGGRSGEDTLPLGTLVLFSNVEEASRKLTQRASGQASRTERIYSKKLFSETFADVLGNRNLLSQVDIEVLLKYMSRDKSLLAYDGKTIKFRAPTDTGPATITSEDATIAALKTLMGDLESQIDRLSQQIENLSIAARESVSRKNRISAVAALRSKKLAETNLSRQSATLGQLEEVYSQIGQAADQVELIRIMEDSTGVLRVFNAEVGGVQRVDDVVDQLKQQMTQVDEIGSAISEVGQTGAIIDENEVDDEVEAMEREERNKKEAMERARKEEIERQEAAEVKRKLDSLEGVERQKAGDREAAAKGSLEDISAVKEAIMESTLHLGRMSLEENTAAEPAT